MCRKRACVSGEKMFIADCKRSRGASFDVSLFIVRITCWRPRSVSTQSEHDEMCATARSKLSEVPRPSTISTRVSSEMCEELFITQQSLPVIRKYICVQLL